MEVGREGEEEMGKVGLFEVASGSVGVQEASIPSRPV